MSVSTMSEFAELIKELRKTKSSRLIYNASIEHAQDLFSELFKEAEETKGNVKIVSGILTEDFYGQFSDTVKRIIDQGISVQLAVLSPKVNLEKHVFATSILDRGGKVFQADEELDTPHYILVGDRGFRLETDHNKTKAVASFNNPEVAKRLEIHFANLVKLPTIREVARKGTETTNPQ